MTHRTSTSLLMAIVAIGGLYAPASARRAHAEVSAPEALSRDFASAHELMLKGEAKSAATLYASLLERGAVHPDVYFNLGNAYARSERWVKAVIAYERSLRLDPTADDTKANLRTVRARLTPNRSEVADAPAAHGLVDLVEPWLAPIPRQVAAAALVMAHAALVLSLLVVRTGRRRVGGVIGAASLLITLAAASVTGGHYLMERDPRAVVLETTVLRKGPDTRFEPTTEAPSGVRVRILDTRGTWYEIQQGDGTAGWISAKGIERV